MTLTTNGRARYREYMPSVDTAPPRSRDQAIALLLLLSSSLGGVSALGCRAAPDTRAEHPLLEQRDAPAAAPRTPSPPAPLFLVVYGPGANFLSGKPLAAQPLREHFAYMLSLHERGVLKSAGGFGDERGGALVITAADEAAALAVVHADPAVKTRVFEFTLRRWHLVDWEKHAAGAK